MQLIYAIFIFGMGLLLICLQVRNSDTVEVKCVWKKSDCSNPKDCCEYRSERMPDDKTPEKICYGSCAKYNEVRNDITILQNQEIVVEGEYGGRKFKAFWQKGSWFQAMLLCCNDGGTLLDIRNKGEYDYLVKFAHEKLLLKSPTNSSDEKHRNSWLGGNNINQKGYSWLLKLNGSNPSDFGVLNDQDSTRSCTFLRNENDLSINPNARVKSTPCGGPITMTLCGYPSNRK